MNVNPDRDFQRRFTGNITFYRISSLYRAPTFLQRSVRSFLHYHKRQILKRRHYPVQARIMSSSSEPGHGPTMPYCSARANWSVKELQQNLEKGLSGSEGPVLKIDVTDIKDRKAIFRKSITDEEPPMKRVRNTYVHAQCLLTIWATGSAKKEDLTYLVKQSKSCTIEAGTKDSGERTAVISMESPFYVRLEELQIKGPRPLNGYGNQLYDMQLTLLPANPTDPWPPFDFLSPPPKMSQRMEADGLVRFPMLLAQWRRLPQLPESPTESLLEVCAYQDSKRYKTKLSLKMDASWSSLNSPLTLNNDKLRDTSSPVPHLPSPVSEEDPHNPLVSTRWVFQGSWEHIHPLDFNGYLCPLCSKLVFKDMDTFHFHLINSHDLFKFELVVKARASSEGQQIIHAEVRVDVANTYPVKVGHRVRDDREMEWQRPQSIFDLEAFLKGDETWLGHESKRPTRLAPPMPRVDARSRSRDTLQLETPVVIKARAAHEVPDMPKPARTRFKVPPAPSDIKFFRLTVKRPLTEGEDISESDDEIDENWLLQKHSDTIESFSDMLQSEKRFIQQYDRHMLNENLSSNLHFREALVRFCRTNRTWLQTKEMKREFHKNAARLVMQGLISLQLLRDCADIIGTSSENHTQNESVLAADGSDHVKMTATEMGKTTAVQTTFMDAEKATVGLLKRSNLGSLHDYGICKCGSRIHEMSQYIRCSNMVNIFRYINLHV